MMRKYGIFLLQVVFFLAFTSRIEANQKVIRLTSVEWPPYTSKRLLHQGMTTAVVRAAFKAMGYKLDVQFFPWKRAVKLAKDRKDFDGYFPEYHAEQIEDNFYFSDSIGFSPLGFVESRGKARPWETLQDLTAYNIGIVDGYINTRSFDTMVKQGKIRVEKSTDDVTNLKKLFYHRIDLAIVDQYVFDFLLLQYKNDPFLIKAQEQLVFQKHLLEVKKLYVCFQKTNRGKELLKIFNNGLKKINVSDILLKAQKDNYKAFSIRSSSINTGGSSPKREKQRSTKP